MKKVNYELSEKNYGNYVVFDELYSKKSEFQQIDVGDSEAFGRILFLDGALQIAEADGHIYHESLIHVPMCMTDVKKVLIMGGGDLCALREVLKHPVEKAVVVEIDGEVIKASKQYLSKINKKSWENSRTEILVKNALEYVKETDEKFDVIVSDLTDPGGAGDYFYSREFYTFCKRAMTDKSILVTHGSISSNPEFTAERVYAGFRELFKHSAFYSTHIQSFNCTYGFLLGSDNIDVSKPDWGKINERSGKIQGELKHYSPEMHRAMFAIPKWMEEKIGKEKYAEIRTWFSDKPPPD
jgi:spermidine synthase